MFPLFLRNCLLTNILFCSLIVEKIDLNNDGFVTQEELKDWIKFTQNRYIVNDVNNQWETHKPMVDGKLSWASFRKNTYGYMSGKNIIIYLH